MNLKIAFAGTPEFAAKHLDALLKANFNIVAVFTQPDRPSGRGKKLQASPVKLVALEHNLPLYQPQSLKNDQIQQEIKNLNLDYLIVVAYGLILPSQLLTEPKFGCINMHASLLPLWRGAAPIQRSILAGDKYTGISLMRMNEGLDRGDVYLKAECSITTEETTTSLTDKICALSCDLLIKNLTNLHNLTPKAQDEELASYAHKLDKQEAELNFEEGAKILHRKIRTFEPAWFLQGTNKQRIRVWQADIVKDLTKEEFANKDLLNLGSGILLYKKATGALVSCGNNSGLILQKIQLPGGKPLAIRDLINGKKLDWQIGKSIYE